MRDAFLHWLVRGKHESRVEERKTLRPFIANLGVFETDVEWTVGLAQAR